MDVDVLHRHLLLALAPVAAVALVAQVPFVLVVHPSLPVHSLADLIALAKDRPGQLSYGSEPQAQIANFPPPFELRRRRLELHRQHSQPDHSVI